MFSRVIRALDNFLDIISSDKKYFIKFKIRIKLPSLVKHKISLSNETFASSLVNIQLLGLKYGGENFSQPGLACTVPLTQGLNYFLQT